MLQGSNHLKSRCGNLSAARTCSNCRQSPCSLVTTGVTIPGNRDNVHSLFALLIVFTSNKSLRSVSAEFKLHLNSLSKGNKAVLDSNMTFEARLQGPDGPVDRNLYIYEWNDNITHPMNTTNHTMSELQKIYFSNTHRSALGGEHVMNVTVYEKSHRDKGHPVANSSLSFFLTGYDTFSNCSVCSAVCFP